MRIGLIIQGPIISGGFTGATHGSGRTRAKATSLVNFNCIPTIQRNTEQAYGLFDEIVLSLWEKDRDKDLSRILEGLNKNILWLSDPTPDPPSSRKPVQGFADFSKINKTRQFYGTLQGAIFLKDKNLDGVIKIRTDQLIDLKLLHSEFHHFLENENKTFFIPYLNPKYPWMIPDFYIGARTDELLKLSGFMANNSIEFHKNVHRDLFYKVAFLNSLNDNNMYPLDLFLRTDVANKKLIKLVHQELSNTWQPGSQDLYSSIFWRGANIVFTPSEYIFSDKNWKAHLKPKFSEQENTDYKLALKFLSKDTKLHLFVFKFLLSEAKIKYRSARSEISYIFRRTKTWRSKEK